jgi:hypothetical protein
VSLDGQTFTQVLNAGNVVNGGKGESFALGTRDLTPGAHVFTLKIVQPTNGNYWIGLQNIALTPADSLAETEQAAAPRIKSVVRLPFPPAYTTVRVARVDGTIDLLSYTRGGEANGPGLPPGVTSESFRRVSTLNGKTVALNMIGLDHANLFERAEIKLPQASFVGTLTKVDYARSLVHTTAKLPTDGRLNGAVIYFNNPGYSRNTAYRIAGISADRNGSVIDLGGASMVLGLANLDDDPLDEHTITTLNPSEYSRALGRPDSHFFHGKLLASEDGKVQTTIRATHFAQPFVINVDSARGLRKGMKVYYYDLRQGDSFVIYNACSLESAEAGAMRLTSTADVKLQAAGPVKIMVNGTWQPARGGKVPWMAGGCLVRLGK